MLVALLTTAVAFGLTAPALADKLPKAATPLTSEEITALYSGESTDWKSGGAYFAPDGTVKGVSGKPQVKTTYKGKWTVSGNEVCMEVTTARSGETVTDCWKYWKSGKDTLTLWSKHFDGSKVDEVNGYYKDEVKKLKAGDLISTTYAAAGGT